MQFELGGTRIFDHKTNEWAIFKSRLSQFLLVNNVKENQGAILLTHLSDESYRLLRNLAYPKVIDTLKYEELTLLLDAHFKQKQCTFADKAKFFGAMKSTGETLSDWAARLRGLASYCDFGTALDTNLRDRFVLGLGSGPERDKLFEQNPSTLTFARALEIAEQVECAREAKAVVVKEEPIFRAQVESGHHRSRGAGGRSGAAQRGPAPADRRYLHPTAAAKCALPEATKNI
uniref:SFRICE_020622 n=1 Tax=Spodoptera frugiperda TaxID=7108 RepID=A0A2H1VXY3_SPOFR